MRTACIYPRGVNGMASLASAMPTADHIHMQNHSHDAHVGWPLLNLCRHAVLWLSAFMPVLTVTMLKALHHALLQFKTWHNMQGSITTTTTTGSNLLLSNWHTQSTCTHRLRLELADCHHTDSLLPAVYWHQYHYVLCR